MSPFLVGSICLISTTAEASGLLIGHDSATTTTTTVVSSTTTTGPIPTTTYPVVTGNTVHVPAEPDALIQAGGDIWVASCSGNAVTEINATTKQIVQELNNPSYQFDCPDALAFDGGHIWVANQLGSSITELNASTGSWVSTLSGSSFLNPNALAVSGTDIWISNDSLKGNIGSFISEIESSNGTVIRVINTPKSYKFVLGNLTCLAVSGTDIWVSDLTNQNAIEFSTDNGAYLRKTTGGPAVTSGDMCDL